MALTREQVAAMSPEERDAMEAQIKARMAQQPQGLLPRQNPMQGLGRLIAGAGQAYTTGKVPMDMFETKSAEPDWYTKQQLEYQQKLELKKEEQRLTEASQRAALENLPEGEWTTDTVRIGDRTLKRQPSPEERQAEIMQLAEKESVKGEAMANRERLKKKRQADVDFEVAKNKLRVTSAAFKAMQEKAGGEGFLPASQAAFGGTKLGRAMGVNPYTKAFEGQLSEAAASLAKLASPSARVGKDIIEIFEKTLPDVWSISNPGEFYSQIRFSLHNAFGTALANAEDEYTPELRAKIDKMVDELVNVPSMTLEDAERARQGLSVDPQSYSLPMFNSEEEAEAANLAPGTQIIIKGKRAIWE